MSKPRISFVIKKKIILQSDFKYSIGFLFAVILYIEYRKGFGYNIKLV